MARGQNFYYQGNPGAEIGTSLARAIFGDPAAAAQQREQQARNDERIARSRLLIAQGDGVENQNRAAASLPELLAGLRPAQAAVAAPIPSIDDPAFLDGAGPSAPAVDPQQAFVAGLPQVMAALAQMQGDKVNSSETIGTLASFLGGDELARRGMVAQGKTPGEDFALTPDRADAISARDAGESQAQAFGVANINHANDIPVANIRAGATTDAAGIRAGATRYVADVRAGGTAPGFDAIQRAIPGATMNSGVRTPERNRAVGGVSNSTHLGQTPGVQGYDIPPQRGSTVEAARAAIEAANPGVRVVEAKDEGDHWHFALKNEGGPAPAGRSNAGGRTRAPARQPAGPKPLTAPQLKMIDAEVTTQFADAGDAVTPDRRANIRQMAVAEFRKTGDPVGAVQTVKAALMRRAQAIKDAGRGASAPAAASGARRNVSLREQGSRAGRATSTPQVIRFDASGNRLP